MEKIIPFLLTNVDFPETISVGLAILALIVAVYLFTKKSGIEEITSNNAIQTIQVKTLLDQVHFLSDELDKARRQLDEIHQQNIHLMEQLRESNRKIQELELFIAVNLNLVKPKT